MASDLAKELILELHEPMKNEECWPIADKYLTLAWKEGFQAGQYAHSRGWEIPTEAPAIPQADGASV